MPNLDNTEMTLFSAVACSLGLEILSGRLDLYENTPGYKQLVEQFDKTHLAFSNASWKSLKQWLAHYNSPSDMAQLLGPVLSQLNQPYLKQQLLLDELANLIEMNCQQLDLTRFILDELALLIEKNHAVIGDNTKWSDLVKTDAPQGKLLFPMLDKLSAEEQTKLLTNMRDWSLNAINPKTVPNIRAYLDKSENSQTYADILTAKIDFSEAPIKWAALIKKKGASGDLFPILDQLGAEEQAKILAAIEKAKVVKQIKARMVGKASADIYCKSAADKIAKSPADVDIREFLQRNAIAKNLIDDLKSEINFAPILSKKGNVIADLKRMMDALHLSVIEKNMAASPSDKRNKIVLTKDAKGNWLAVPNPKDVAKFVKSKNQATRDSYFAAPTAEELSALSDVLPDIEFVDERIDNPGEGDCAYYAFAEGLIKIIQEEGTGNTKKFREWVALDSSLSDLYNDIMKFDFQHRDNTLLGKLQVSLRKIQALQQVNELPALCVKATNKDNLPNDPNGEAYKKEIKRRYQAVAATPSYNDFAAWYLTPDDIDPNYNLYATSDAIKNAFTPQVKSEIENGYEELVLVPLFIKLIYGPQQDLARITKDTRVDANSPALTSMSERINTVKAYWGTARDLTVLAETFKVNLHILENGHEPRNASVANIPDRHVIVVDNLGNGHWETQIRFAVDTKKVTPGNGTPVTTPKKGSPVADKKESNDTHSFVEIPVSNGAIFLAEKPVLTEAKGINSPKSKAEPKIPSPKGNASDPNSMELSALKKKMDNVPTTPQLPAPPLHATAGPDAMPEQGHAANAGPRRPRPLVRQPRATVLGETPLQPILRPGTESSAPPDDPFLAKLKMAVMKATREYTNYNRSVWYSIFHRHGKTGRIRADNFNTRLSTIKNPDEARKVLIEFLNNDSDNGNTHPHSYRTMLLNQMFAGTSSAAISETGKKKPTLQETSDKFDEQLKDLAIEWRINMDSLKQSL